MQGQAALLKREIEAKLANRIPAALSPLAQQVPRHLPTGDGRLDSLLGGGFPLGSLCEITGLSGSGRTSIALSLLASASGEGACAYIDASAAFCPQSAAAAGIELANLLWVQLGTVQGKTTDPARQRFQSSAQIGARDHRPIHSGCGGSHPRGETKGLAPALQQMLREKTERRQEKMEGMPGHPNQPIGLHTASQEQVDWERWNLRKPDATDPMRLWNKQAAEAARVRAAVGTAVVRSPQKQERSWDRLAAALRAADQIMQSGGFRVVVLDLASVHPQQALRIPSATWFRFRRAAQEADSILLLLTQEPCARSSAACVLRCAAPDPEVQGVLSAVPRTAEVLRQRTGNHSDKKAPGRAVQWSTVPAWMQAVGL